jgi:hypothetical protein
MESRTTRTHVVIPVDLLAEIDRVAGPRKRSEFIVNAVDAALRSRRQLEALKAVMDAGPIEWGIPGWEGVDPAEQIRRLRRGEVPAPEAVPPATPAE